MLLAPSVGKRVQASRSCFELFLIGQESGARFFNQSQSGVKQNTNYFRHSMENCSNFLFVSETAGEN